MSKPKFGWANWNLPNLKERISYLNDFPFDLFDKLIIFFKTEECQELEFDAEGYFYTIYIGSPVYVKIEDEDEVTPIYGDVEKFTNELINDIEQDMGSWSTFPTYCESDEDAKKIEEKLKDKIKEVREALILWKKS